MTKYEPNTQNSGSFRRREEPLRQEPYLVHFEEYLTNLREISVTTGTLEDSVGLHWHDFCEIEFVARGNGTHCFNQQVIPFAAGSLHALLPTDFHEVCVDRKDPPLVYSVKFSEMILDREIYSAVFKNNVGKQLFVPSDMHGAVLRIFQELTGEYNGHQLFREKTMLNLLEQALIILGRLAQREGGGAEHVQVSTNVVVCTMTYIRENFFRPLTLEQISSNVHISPNYLSGLFRKTAGFTISEYLKKTRMRYAVMYLLDRNRTIMQISEEVGYNSYENFERVFRKEFGISPREFRSRLSSNGLM